MVAVSWYYAFIFNTDFPLVYGLQFSYYFRSTSLFTRFSLLLHFVFELRISNEGWELWNDLSTMKHETTSHLWRVWHPWTYWDILSKRNSLNKYTATNAQYFAEKLDRYSVNLGKSSFWIWVHLLFSSLNILLYKYSLSLVL